MVSSIPNTNNFKHTYLTHRWDPKKCYKRNNFKALFKKFKQLMVRTITVTDSENKMQENSKNSKKQKKKTQKIVEKRKQRKNDIRKETWRKREK